MVITDSPVVGVAHSVDPGRWYNRAIPWTQRDWHPLVEPVAVGRHAVYMPCNDARSFTGRLVLRADLGKTWGY